MMTLDDPSQLEKVTKRAARTNEGKNVLCTQFTSHHFFYHLANVVQPRVFIFASEHNYVLLLIFPQNILSTIFISIISVAVDEALQKCYRMAQRHRGCDPVKGHFNYSFLSNL